MKVDWLAQQMSPDILSVWGLTPLDLRLFASDHLEVFAP